MVVQQFAIGCTVRIENPDLPMIAADEQDNLAVVVGYDLSRSDKAGILEMLTGRRPGHKWFFRSGLVPMGGPW